MLSLSKKKIGNGLETTEVTILLIPNKSIN